MRAAQCKPLPALADGDFVAIDQSVDGRQYIGSWRSLLGEVLEQSRLGGELFSEAAILDVGNDFPLDLLTREHRFPPKDFPQRLRVAASLGSFSNVGVRDF